MTENKRFNFNIMFGEDEYTGTVFENGKILKTTDVVYLLNEIWNENEQLKKSIKRQQSSNEECSKYIEEVVKENEQLKSTNMEMEDYLGRLEERIIKLEKENERFEDGNIDNLSACMEVALND